MHRNRELLGALMVVALVLWVADGAYAAKAITFDENGNGYTDGTRMDWGVGSPGDFGIPGHATLYYQFPGHQSVAGGDVVVLEPTGAASDLLRFAYYTDPTGDYGRVFVYSDAEETQPGEPKDAADTGIPPLWANVVYVDEVGSEGNNGIIYTPTGGIAGTPNQTGYMEDGVTYNFTSDVPEPATLSLLVLGGLAVLRRRK